jgi:glutathione S-transferase
MAKSGVKILGAWPSPFVMRARIALDVKAAEYEFLQETVEAPSPIQSCLQGLSEGKSLWV